MPVYAPTPGFTERRRHPIALALIIAAHAVVIGAVMTAKMDLPAPWRDTPTIVEAIPLPEPPPPEPQPPQPKSQPRESVVDRPHVIVPIPQPNVPQVDATPIPHPPPNPGDLIGPSLQPQPLPQPVPQPRAEPVRVAARLATPESRIRPPYPAEKLRTDEEAALRLRLRIDERGRVVAVEPVGSADPAFLEAARRHLLAHWRYKPATEDGRPVPSTTVITLRFQLED